MLYLRHSRTTPSTVSRFDLARVNDLGSSYTETRGEPVPSGCHHLKILMQVFRICFASVAHSTVIEHLNIITPRFTTHPGEHARQDRHHQIWHRVNTKTLASRWNDSCVYSSTHKMVRKPMYSGDTINTINTFSIQQMNKNKKTVDEQLEWCTTPWLTHE